MSDEINIKVKKIPPPFISIDRSITEDRRLSLEDLGLILKSLEEKNMIQIFEDV